MRGPRQRAAGESGKPLSDAPIEIHRGIDGIELRIETRDGLVAFKPNPHHLRPRLVFLTEQGRNPFEAAMGLQKPWIKALPDDISAHDAGTACRVILSPGAKLKAMNADGDVNAIDSSRQKKW